MPPNNTQIALLKTLKKNNCMHAGNMLAKKNEEDIGLFFDEYEKFYEASQNQDIDVAVKGLNAYKSFQKRLEKNRESIDDMITKYGYIRR